MTKSENNEDNTQQRNVAKTNRRPRSGMNVSLLTRVMILIVAVWLIACTLFAKHFLNRSGGSSMSHGHSKSLWKTLVNSHSGRNSNLRTQTSKIARSLAKSSVLGTKLFPITPPAKKIEKRELVLTIPLFYNRQVRIQLRPEWSQGSVDYFHRLEQHRCASCSLYRLARQHDDGPGEGVILGIMQNSKSVPLNTQRGTCPQGTRRHFHDPEEEESSGGGGDKKVYDDDNPQEDCENCECQGPILRRGMVAWVGGTPGGPEFLINLYEDKIESEGSRHAVFGEIVDHESFALLEEILDEDTSEGNARVLNSELHFYIDLE